MARVLWISSWESSSSCAISSTDAVEGSGAVERNADDPALLGEGLQDGLLDPPDGVGDELDALGLVELVGRADEPDVALVDEVAERDALILVLLGDGHDEPEVGADERVERFLFPLPDPLGQLDLPFASQQRIGADLLQVLVEGAFLEGALLLHPEPHRLHGSRRGPAEGAVPVREAGTRSRHRARCCDAVEPPARAE
jgi:hypothetical protein